MVTALNALGQERAVIGQGDDVYGFLLFPLPSARA
jgi:hypothetical protein